MVARSPEGVTLLVKLWVAPGMRDRFDAYETKAFEIMSDHGARVLRRDRDVAGVDEVHELWFPSDAALSAYRADPRIEALADERAAVIERTEILR